MDKDFGQAPKVTKAPAIGYSITAGLGDRRQMVVQCFVAEDEDDAVVNAKVDRIMRVIDRQQAVYDLDAELEGFHKVGSMLEQFLSTLPIAERNFQAQTAELTVQLQAFEDARKETFDAGYTEFAQRGGKGEYKPKGHRAADLARLDNEIAKKKEQIEKAAPDQAQARSEAYGSIRHHQADLKKRRVRVNHLLSLLGRPPMEDYADAEAFDVGAKTGA